MHSYGSSCTKSPYYDSGPKDQERRRKALETRQQALDCLRDHLASDKLPLVVPGADDKFLRAVLEKSPHRHIRGLACYTLAEQVRHLAIGMPAPALKSVDLDGKPVQLADLKGKVLVLDVWECGAAHAGP
jgi:hypothetical protein